MAWTPGKRDVYLFREAWFAWIIVQSIDFSARDDGDLLPQRVTRAKWVW